MKSVEAVEDLPRPREVEMAGGLESVRPPLFITGMLAPGQVEGSHSALAAAIRASAQVK